MAVRLLFVSSNSDWDQVQMSLQEAIASMEEEI